MPNKDIIHLTVGPIATNCWIYPMNEKDAAVIDPGDEAEVIISALKERDLFPSFILLTHGHFDHIAALPALVSAFSKKPQIAIHSLEAETLGPDSYSIHSRSIKAAMGNSSFVDELWREMPPADRLLEEGDTIGSLTVLHLPGHTQGSCAFWDKEENIIFTGDTLFRGTHGRTDFPGGNENEMRKSLSRLFEMDGNITVCPGHYQTTTIGREAARNMI